MAVAEKYNVHVKTPFGDYRIFKIYEEGYSGAVTNIRGTKEPLSQNLPGSDTNIYEPIMGSEVRVNIVVQTKDQYIEFATATNKQYLGILYNHTLSLVEWQGWLVPEEFEQNESTLPQTVNLTFSCGLGYLAQVDYENPASASPYYTGREREIVILAQALAEITADSPYNLDIRSILNLHPTGAATTYIYDALYYSYIDQNKYINEDGTVWNCLDVIRDIMKSYRARIIMGARGWWVVRIRALAVLEDDKDIYYTRYTSAGAYTSRGVLTPAQCVATVTGPNITSRAEDIAWTGRSKRSRFERAYQSIKILFEYGYKNALIQGTFLSDNWADFWTTEAGTIIRTTAQEEEEEYVIQMEQELMIGNVILQQIVENIKVHSSDQIVVFKADTRFLGYEDGAEAIFYIHVFLDADSTSTNDRYLDGYIDSTGVSGRALTWSASDFPTVVLYKARVSDGQWTSMEITMPAIPWTGDLYFELWGCLISGAKGDYCEWSNVQLLGNYDGNDLVKSEEIDFEISTDNLIVPEPIEITSGDITQHGNEHIFYGHAKSLNSAGTSLTTTWRSFYPSGGAKVLHGPTQTLVEYVRDNQIIQHGLNRKRLQGSMTFNWYRLAYSLIKDGDTYYVPTSFSYKFMSNQLKVSMLELPPIDDIIIDENLIANWGNGIDVPPGWDTFTVTADPLIDTLSQGADAVAGCFADNIVILHPYESFRVQVSGTFDTGKEPSLIIGSSSTVVSDGDDFIINPRTTAGNIMVFLWNNRETFVTHTNVLIKITRVYGF